MDDGSEAALVVTARELVDQASAILLDFDGPVCSVFAGVAAPAVAASIYQRAKVLMPSGAFTDVLQDPLELVRAIHIADHGVGVLAARWLTSLELKAVQTAKPTAGAARFMATVRRRRVPLAIVSNNSSEAICSYLAVHDLTDLVHEVWGRDPEHVQLMKPNPHLVRAALAGCRAQPGQAILIGDSVTDVQAATQAGVTCVGLANRPQKIEPLRAAGAETIIESMRELLPPPTATSTNHHRRQA